MSDVDSSPEAIAAMVARLRVQANARGLAGVVEHDAAALLAQVARERDAYEAQGQNWQIACNAAERQLAEARAALKSLYDAYVATLASGRGRITELGGDCDTVDRMEQSDPALRKARALLSGERT